MGTILLLALGKLELKSAKEVESQCAALNLKLDEIELSIPTTPEAAALAFFRTHGYSGAACEGGVLLTLLKALCLDALAERNSFGSRADACTRLLEAQFTILADQRTGIIDALKGR